LIPDDIIREYADIYCDWSDSVKDRFGPFKVNAKMRKLVSKIIDKKTALILGAGLSSTTGSFKKYWKKYEDIYNSLTNDPAQVEGFESLYSYGGIKAVPKFGNDVIPNLVQASIISTMLIFNYNCHVEHCLIMCDVGYQSLSYCGKNYIERVAVGKPKCRIFKPHGSSRLTQKPTPIIWPKRQPEHNFTILKKFVTDVKKNNIEQVMIIGWSGNDDPYVRGYLEDLKKSGIHFIQIGLPYHTKDNIATWGWDLVDEYIRDFEGGGIDVLYGLAKEIGLDNPCVVDDDPLERLSENAQKMKVETEKMPV
jgi:hypothetical protein